MTTQSMTYADAGVNISAGNSFADMIRERVAGAWPFMGKEIGGFAGSVPLSSPTQSVSGCSDGSGTVAILAAAWKKFHVLGRNGGAMSLVDIYVAGNRPVGLLDVLDVGSLIPHEHIQVIEGLIGACQKADCVLMGGETAELPGLYKEPWMVNVNTTAVGVPDTRILSGDVRPWDLVYGWPSFGPGSNGFSLIRKVFDLQNCSREEIVKRLETRPPALAGQSLGAALLQPVPIWIQEVEELRSEGIQFKAHAHITGGGLVENIPRVLPEDCKAVITRPALQSPPIFKLIQETGNVEQAEMDRTFNQGIMMVSILPSTVWKVPLNSPLQLIGRVQPRFGDEPQVVFSDEWID